MVSVILVGMLVTPITGNNMADQEVKTEMPWEKSWIMKKVQPLVDAVAEAKSGTMPWERQWKEKEAKPVAVNPAVQATGRSYNQQKDLASIAANTTEENRSGARIEPASVKARRVEQDVLEIKSEMSKTKDPKILSILQTELKKRTKNAS